MRRLLLPLGAAVAIAAAALAATLIPTTSDAATVLSVGKTATATSSYTGYPAKYANDGNTTTRWMAASNSYPQKWTVDLGSKQTIGQVTIAWQTANSRSYGYHLYGSNDNSTWTLLKDRSANTTRGTTVDTVSGAYRYVRVRVDSSTYGWAQIFEVSVYAPTTSVTPTPTPTSTSTPAPGPTATFSPTPTPTPTVTFTPSPTPTPTSIPSVSVATYGHDRAAVDAATSAAVSQGKALYFPAGTYNLGSTPWQVPDNLKVYGDGGLNKASWIQGYVLAGGHQSFTDVMIGSKTGRALGWKNIATRFSGTVFTRVRFRGGAAQTVQFAGSGSSVTKGVKIDGLTFNYCWFEATYSTSGTARTFGVYTDRAMGQLFRNVTFSHCWFDSPNEKGTYSSWGGLEIWSSHDDLSSYPSDPANRGYDNLDFEYDVFEPTYGWELDLSGYQYVTDPNFGEGSATVRGCVFKGSGHLNGLDPSGSGFHQGLTAEPGFNCLVENNYFGRSYVLATGFTKNSNHNVVRNNVFDYVYTGLGLNVYNYAAIARFGPNSSGFNDNSFTGNVLRLPVGVQTGLSAQGWITTNGNATVSGNSVVHASNSLIDYSKTQPALVTP